MDIQNALLVVVAVVGLVSLVKRLVPSISTPLDGALTMLVAIVIAIGVLFLARETAWANEQVIGGKALDQLDSASVVFAGLLVGLGSTVTDRLLKTVSNVGANVAKYEDSPPG